VPYHFRVADPVPIWELPDVEKLYWIASSFEELQKG